MKVSTFNVENLFTRPKTLDLETWAEGQPILNDIQKLNKLLAKDRYTDSVKAKLLVG